jgi:hypothetical protein
MSRPVCGSVAVVSPIGGVVESGKCGAPRAWNARFHAHQRLTPRPGVTRTVDRSAPPTSPRWSGGKPVPGIGQGDHRRKPVAAVGQGGAGGPAHRAMGAIGVVVPAADGAGAVAAIKAGVVQSDRRATGQARDFGLQAMMVPRVGRGSGTRSLGSGGVGERQIKRKSRYHNSLSCI